MSFTNVNGIFYKVIQHHQGELTIECTLNQETVVHVYIPIWEEDV